MTRSLATAHPAGILATLRLWRARRRSRTVLSRLDARLLDDCGIAHEDALHEAARPFWKPGNAPERRIRMATVRRDYGLSDCADPPRESRQRHDPI